MIGVMVDTHALLWHLFEPVQLSDRAISSLRGTIRAGETIYASTISIIEVCYLVEKRRLPPETFDNLVLAFHDVEIPVMLLPVDEDVALAVERISRPNFQSLTEPAQDRVVIPNLRNAERQLAYPSS